MSNVIEFRNPALAEYDKYKDVLYEAIEEQCSNSAGLIEVRALCLALSEVLGFYLSILHEDGDDDELFDAIKNHISESCDGDAE